MGRDPGRSGFSEEALQGLRDFERRVAPPDSSLPVPGWVPDSAPREPAGNPTPGHATPAPGPGQGPGQPHYWGHRERLRQRFLGGGPDAMPDYELLELVLFNAIGRIDVKPLAKQLLAAFGDLNGVIAASEAQVLRVPGATPRVFLQLRILQAVGHRMAKAKVMRREVIGSWDALMAYCKAVMAYRDTEQFRILFLDTRNTLIADEEQAKGTVNHVPVYPREVAKRALELGATAIILVHNHPSGDPTPSRADIEVTESIEAACRAIGVALFDHIIIGKAEDASFRTLGLI